MTAFPKIDSILFDLDGTLWDASGSCTRAWKEALDQMGRDHSTVSEAMIRSLSGLKIDIILKKHFGFIPEKDHEELLRLYHAKEKEFMKTFGGELFPGVKDVLIVLAKKYRLFIVSNCLEGYIENFIAFHQLQNLFTDFECSGNTGLAKNENIQLVIDRNHLQNPVYVGDTVWDYEAAQKAKVPFIYASYGFGQLDHPDYKIDEFGDLEKLVR